MAKSTLCAHNGIVKIGASHMCTKKSRKEKGREKLENYIRHRLNTVTSKDPSDITKMKSEVSFSCPSINLNSSIYNYHMVQ